MYGEDSLHFWIIPIAFLALGVTIFVIIIEYNINVLWPNAATELEEIKKMSCDEIKVKDGNNDYWTRENGKIGKEKADGCVEAELAAKKAEKEKQDAILADPNSLESLTRDLKKFQELYNSTSASYKLHASQAEILKQNVTDFENQVEQIKSKLAKEYGVK
ncbi:MAG: hypothetical protein K8Q89_10345 [Nitrosarchaeum sp.]|nr:hypothetical protein [Nitrosarchaeum sp.]